MLRDVLDRAGVPADEVLEQVADGWPMKELRTAHEASVAEHQVFGVPTFVLGERAAFVRLMTRPGGDADLARSTIERVLDLVAHHPEVNELKHTTIPR